MRQEPKNSSLPGCPPNETVQGLSAAEAAWQAEGMPTTHIGLLFCSWVGVAVLREYHGGANKVAGLDGFVELRDDGFRNFSEVFLHVYHDQSRAP